MAISLAAKRAAPSRRPANIPTASDGAVAKPSPRMARTVTGARVGSTSLQGKRAQARNDG